MGVVRDVTIDNLTQAVQGISSTGISDSTGQAINDTLGTLGKDISLQGIISAINGLTSSLGRKIIIDTVQFATTQILSSQVDYTFTFDVGKTGYTPLGIVGITKSGSYNTRFNQNKWFISGNNVTITLRCSEAGVSANGITLDVTILYSQL